MSAKKKIFISYAHEDDAYRIALCKHLKVFERAGVAVVWHDRQLDPGSTFAGEIDTHLDDADVFIALVSADYLDSDYCMDIELKAALERRARGTLDVVPVIARACAWTHSSLGEFLALPQDGKSIRQYEDEDVAYGEVVDRIQTLLAPQAVAGPDAPVERDPGVIAVVDTSEPQVIAAAPRAIRARVRPSFTDLDRDRYLDEAFVLIKSVFEESLKRLKADHSFCDFRFTPVSSNVFTATIYRDGEKVAGCTISVASELRSRSIRYHCQDDGETNSYNEELHVEDIDGELKLKALMGGLRGLEDSPISQHRAARHFWEMFTQPLAWDD